MDIITRKDAMSQGLTRYFTGIPCKHGHICERNKHRHCLECLRVANKKDIGGVSRKEYIAKYRIQYYEKNKKSMYKRCRQWCVDNPEKYSANGQRGYLKAISTPEGKAKHRARTALWRLANRGRINYLVARRRKGTKDRTPAWADKGAIKFFYECCPKGCHVDHVIPLLGKNISGLHVAENLQWLPATENIKKGNSWS